MPDSERPPTGYAVFCGLDVGKSEHHVCAVDTDGKRVHDKPLPNDETALRTVFTDLGVRLTEVDYAWVSPVVF